jgi:hypothetical protein
MRHFLVHLFLWFFGVDGDARAAILAGALGSG